MRRGNIIARARVTAMLAITVMAIVPGSRACLAQSTAATPGKASNAEAVGQRKTNEDLKAGVHPMSRVASRIESRVQSRINNRIERGSVTISNDASRSIAAATVQAQKTSPR